MPTGAMNGLIVWDYNDRRAARAGDRPAGRPMFAVLICGLALALSCPSQAADKRIQSSGETEQELTAHIVQALVKPHGGRTCFSLVSTRRLAPRIYVVKNPERVVIDAANAHFRLPQSAKPRAGGLIDGVRYGVLASGQARIVIDVESGTRVGKVLSRKRRDDLHQLIISLTNGVLGERPLPCDAVVAQTQQASLLSGGSPAKAAQKAHSIKPVVVVDPGHGGVDPGAVVNKVYLEKIIALAVGRRLAARLRKDGRFKVVMTRSRDAFVSLDDRVERARANKADLFISLHADSLDDAREAKKTHGAVVYILSHRASDAEAKRLAEKENAADLLAGILPTKASEDGVRNILVDLLKRETEHKSARLRKLLIARMRAKVPVSRNPYRSAAFRVLKQTETPAALIELGYMTNAADLQRMRRADWQDRVAAAVAAAIGQFFHKK